MQGRREELCLSIKPRFIAVLLFFCWRREAGVKGVTLGLKVRSVDE